VWDRLRVAGMEFGLEPIGYRALDALRMEKGYRYYGTDLTMLETPFEAGLGPFVRLEKGPFIGREALTKAKAVGSDRRLRTLLIGGPDYVPVYAGEAVRQDGEVIGRLRSVAYGPTVERTIGYAYLSGAAAQGTELEIDVFDRRIAATIAPDALVDPRGERMRG
jgi:glycine cleavage system aminomethyltransferase T